MKKYYLIYKVVNKINGKYYIGKHVTINPYDTYLGSGKLINKAIKKYGRENFTKEILCYTDNKELLIKKEIEIVNEDVVNDQMSYNMATGGGGGFTVEEAKRGRIAANKVGAHIKGGKAAIKKFTKEQRSRIGKKGGASLAKRLRGVSKSGNVNWHIVRDIRAMYNTDIIRKDIRTKYPLLSPATIYDITTYRTWIEI